MTTVQLFFAIIGALCSFGIVIMLLALVLFWSERHAPDTFGDGSPDANAERFPLCIFCGHPRHAAYLCRAAGAGACACRGDPGADEVAAAWERACSEFDEKHSLSSKGKGWNG